MSVYKGKNQKYGNESLGNEEKGKNTFYETFDSGDGVLVPEGMEGDFMHADGPDLDSYCMNPIDLDAVEGGAVPEVPLKKHSR